MSWNDEKIEKLKKLWAEGHSAGQIAGRMPGTSRSAVIGKIHRLGLSGRATVIKLKSTRKPRLVSSKPAPQRSNAKSATRAAAVQKMFEAEPFQPSEELDVPLHQRKTVETLEEKSCRWPIGDPQDEAFHFCGADKVTGLPYCEFHCRKAFQPPQGKKPSGSPKVTPARPEMPVAAEQIVDAGEVELEDVE